MSDPSVWAIREVADYVRDVEEEVSRLRKERDELRDGIMKSISQAMELHYRIKDAVVLHAEQRMEGVYLDGISSLRPGKYALVRLKDDEL